MLCNVKSSKGRWILDNFLANKVKISNDIYAFTDMDMNMPRAENGSN